MNPGEVMVRVADMAVGAGDQRLTTVGLGSCIAIVLHDPVALVGGLAHVLLPSPSLSRREGSGPGRFPQSAVPALLEAMASRGADPRRIRARLVGGEDVGGDFGRSVTLDVATGTLHVTSVRQGTRAL